MRKAKPKISTTEEVRLKVIAVDVGASANEMLDALIYWVYLNPPRQWREILQTYRKSKRGDDGNG